MGDGGEGRKGGENKTGREERETRTHGADFPEDDSIGPDVRAGSELSGLDGLKSHPLQREPAFGLLHIHFLHLARQPEVGDLQVLPLSDQDVPTRQITMHYVDAGQVLLKK